MVLRMVAALASTDSRHLQNIAWPARLHIVGFRGTYGVPFAWLFVGVQPILVDLLQIVLGRTNDITNIGWLV
eukprot:877049-Pleurochrysis_carterae.AAC.3